MLGLWVFMRNAGPVIGGAIIFGVNSKLDSSGAVSLKTYLVIIGEILQSMRFCVELTIPRYHVCWPIYLAVAVPPRPSAAPRWSSHHSPQDWVEANSCRIRPRQLQQGYVDVVPAVLHVLVLRVVCGNTPNAVHEHPDSFPLRLCYPVLRHGGRVHNRIFS